MPKSLWDIKELKSYTNQLQSSTPPAYNMGRTTSYHQHLESIIRKYWNLLHPIVQDYLTSFTIHWTNSEENLTKLMEAIKEKNETINRIKSNVEKKIKDLNLRVLEKDESFQKVLQEASTKQQELISIKDKLEKDVEDLVQTHIEVGESFQDRIVEMDLKLREKEKEIEKLKRDLSQKDIKIKQLTQKNSSG